MNQKRTITALVAVAVLLAGFPAGAAATGDLSIDVTQNDDGSATVTVADNGTAAANATVEVNASASNDTYAGEGSYQTDANGTVSLPAPADSNVTVDVTATLGNDSAATTVTLENATVNETETLNETEAQSAGFGQRVQAFVQELFANGPAGGGIGEAVSAFVTANNPGADHRSENADAALNASDSHGKSDHAGKPADAGNVSGNGRPDHAGNASDADEEEDDEKADRGNGKAKGKK